MQKAYNRIIWHNKPDTRSPINESNLNRIDIGLDTVDDRVITLDTTKANQTDLLTCVASIGFNQSTGILTITLQNGTSTTIDTGLSKLAVNFDYDDDPTSPHYEQLVLEMKDGTYKYIDLSALINQFEFDNTTTVVFSVDSQTGHISAIVPDGSITESKLQPNFLADCRTEKTQAQAARAGAETAESNAEDFKEDAEAWANGEINGVPVPSTHPAHHNNAKYYKDQAASTTFKALTDVNTDEDFEGIDIEGIEEGQTVIYDSTEKKLIPGDSAGYLKDLKDTSINGSGTFTLTDNELMSDGHNWINKGTTKNLIEFPYYSEQHKIIQGIEWTYDKDGIIHAVGTGQSGTGGHFYLRNGGRARYLSTSSRYVINLEISGTIKDDQGNIVPSYEDYVTFDYLLRNVDSSYYQAKSLKPSQMPYSLSISEDKKIGELYINIIVNNNYQYDLTFKPIIYDSYYVLTFENNDTSYCRHAMSNQELTIKHNVKDMFDSNISNPTPGQTLVYNSEGKLENATPSGSGHTILNSAGTALTSRTNLQFAGGLNATDDSDNNKSVVDDNYEVIPWTTWQGYTDAQKAQHPNAIVTDAPDCDGDAEIEFMKLVWTNPTPNTSFPNQQIPLNTDGNYTHFRAKFKVFYTDTNYFWRDFKKGENVFIETNDLANLRLCRRGINSTSDTQLTIGSGVIRDTFNRSGQPADDGRYVIPIEIYTYNKDLTAKIKAIAHDVSTSASKCMMSDDQTSVEEAITKNKISSYVTITSYTPHNRYTFPCDGYVTLNNRGSNYNALALIVGANDDSSYTIGIGGAQGQFGLHVKKGMKTYIYEGTTAGYYFLPLSS